MYLYLEKNPKIHRHFKVDILKTPRCWLKLLSLYILYVKCRLLYLTEQYFWHLSALYFKSFSNLKVNDLICYNLQPVSNESDVEFYILVLIRLTAFRLYFFDKKHMGLRLI